MTEYDFQREKCAGCGSICFCIQTGVRWLCQECFTWSIGYADQKDMVIQIMTEAGIEPILEEPIHDIRDLD